MGAVAEMPPELLWEMENFYLDRATKNLHSLKRTLEAQMGPIFDGQVSGKLDNVLIALEAITSMERAG